MLADAPCFVDERLPTRGKTISPARESSRFRDNFALFNGCHYAAERCDGGHYPYIEQEEAGVLGLPSPIQFDLVINGDQYGLPSFPPSGNRVIPSKQALALMVYC